MRVENRELYVSFWDTAQEAGVYALLVGWNDELRPLVAYSFGVHLVETPFEVFGTARDAERSATYMREPK